VDRKEKGERRKEKKIKYKYRVDEKN